MPSVEFQVEGTAFRLEGDSELAQGLRLLYGGFSRTGAARTTHDIEWHDLKCVWRTDSRSARFLLVRDPRLRISVTASLIARLLVESLPGRLIFHGNALVHREGGRPLILMGTSGAGKTTLALGLEKGGVWRAFAEDVLLTNPDSPGLAPYPRARSIRDAGDSATDVPILGTEAKLWRAHPAIVSTASASLADAIVVLLEPGELRPTAHPSNREFAWSTSCPDEAIAACRKANLPLAGHEIDGLFDRLEFAPRLLDAERVQLAAILEDHGGLLVHTGSSRRVDAGVPVRPPEPVLRALESGEGVRRCMTHLVRPTARFAARPPGELFMGAARAFRSARFFRFIPGGTVDDSVRLLEGLASR